jgi:hypothetical protein
MLARIVMEGIMGRNSTLTWLDSFILAHREILSKKEGRQLSLLGALQSTREFSKTLLVRYDPTYPDTIVGNDIPVMASPEATRLGISLEELFRYSLLKASLNPFVHHHTDAYGVRINRELIDTFAHAKVPDEPLMLEHLVKHAWYFDFLDSGLQFILGGRLSNLRAILINPISSLTRDLCFRRPERLEPIIFAVYDPDVPGATVGEDFCYWYWRRDDSQQDRRQVVCPITPDVQRAVEDLIGLIVLYLTMTPLDSHPPLPYLPTKSLRKMGKVTQQKQLRSASLFRLVDVRPPTDRFGRTVEHAGKGYRLDQRITVRGHFRWQPHGPQSALRKLIWIDPYEKGSQETESGQVPLYRVR